MITHLETCPIFYQDSSSMLSCHYWESWFTNPHSVPIIQADQLTTAPEANSKLPHVSEQCSHVMLIHMCFPELPGLYHVLNFQLTCAVKSGSSFWIFLARIGAITTHHWELEFPQDTWSLLFPESLGWIMLSPGGLPDSAYAHQQQFQCPPSATFQCCSKTHHILSCVKGVLLHEIQ